MNIGLVDVDSHNFPNLVLMKAKQQLWYQENKEAIKEKSKNRYNFRREHGLCTRCGKKAEEGKSKCARCRIRDKVNRLKRNDA